jgi:hypothetical protein
MNGQAAVALVLGVVVTMFVPALVWATVIAGLVQIVREKVRKRGSFILLLRSRWAAPGRR